MTVLEFVATTDLTILGGSWPTLAYILGPAIGSAITVLGVWLTSKHARDQQRDALNAAAAQQETAYKNDVRKEHMAQVLDERRSVYLDLLDAADGVQELLARSRAYANDANVGDVDFSDVSALASKLRHIEHRSWVHCEAGVRQEAWDISDSVDKWLKTWEERPDGLPGDSPQPPDGLAEAASRLRGAIHEASVKDRSSPAEPDGLGGM